MSIGSLAREELEYELRIRGVTDLSTVVHMRRTLRNLRKLTQHSSQFPTYPFAFPVDSAAIRNKLDEISTLLSTFTTGRDSAEYRKITNKLAFVWSRIQNSQPTSEAEKDGKTAFTVEVAQLTTSLQSKLRLLTRQSTMADVSLNPLSANGSALSDHSSQSSDEEETQPTSMLAPQFSAVLPCQSSKYSAKPIPVSSWGLKFTGDPKQLSVSAFLQRVAELKVARNSTDDLIYRSAIDLFSGNALIWFRANHHSYRTWPEIAGALRAEFQAYDYDERLLEEIKHRTQGNSESIGIYMAIMKGLFSRLSVTLSEKAQLKIMLRNLLPYFQTQLGLTEVNSVSELLRFGRLLEAKRSTVEAFVPPPTRNKVLEPDLAYVSVDTIPTTSTRTPQLNVSSSAPDTRRPTKAVVCWNCRREGHRLSNCPLPRKRLCFRCGNPNVTVHTCPRCSGNEQGRR